MAEGVPISYELCCYFKSSASAGKRPHGAKGATHPRVLAVTRAERIATVCR